MLPARPRLVRLAVLVAFPVAVLPVALLGGARAAAEGPEGAPLVQEKASALTWRAAAAMEKPPGPLGEQDFRLEPTALVNPGAEPVEVRASNLLLVQEGGWLEPLNPPAMTGTLYPERPVVPAGGETAFDPMPYRALHPATHALLSLSCGDGHAELAVPIVREGFETPGAFRAPYPFGVGVVGPLEILPLSDGVRSIVVVGQHQSLTGAVPEKVETVLFVGNDAGVLAETRWKGLDAEGAVPALQPFVRRVDVPGDFHAGRMRIAVTATLEGKEVRWEGDWTVKDAEVVDLYGPVLGGTWQLGNGPGQRDFHGNYAVPQRRYAYDLVVTEQGRTYRGDGQSNRSFFAWDRSIRAAADGVVVDVCDAERDNVGNQKAQGPCMANRIVLQHDGGVYTVYLHLKQGSRARDLVKGAHVTAGQPIARVGNSGDSTEPHLTFLAYRIDATGRVRAVPVSFRNAFHDAKGEDHVVGVPKGGDTCHFIDSER